MNQKGKGVMAKTEVKKGNIVLDTYIGNCHLLVNDAYILTDEEEIQKQLKRAGEIIWNGIPKVKK